LTADRIAALAAAVRLDLDRHRAGILIGQMEQVFGLLDSLDRIDLGETAPAIAYSACWKS